MGSIRNVLYGYSVEKGVIVLNREEAPIVFEAFNRYLQNEKSHTTVTRRLGQRTLFAE